MRKSLLMSVALLICATSLCIVSCEREDPINPEEEVIVKEDPYKDWPKLTAFSEEDTRVSYDGLVTGDDSKRIFDSHFDAGDKIYLVVNGTAGVAEYEYKYVAKGQPWEAVDNDGAPYDPNFEYYAYWNGKNVSLLSFLSHTYTMIGDDQLISFFARALRNWSNNVIDIKNQGTLAKFKAQDILTGLGEVRGENSVKFTLYHAMGLACIQKITGGAQTVKSIKTLRNDEYYKWVEETTTDMIIGTSESAPHGCWPYSMGTGTDEKYQYWYLWIPPRELEGKAIISSDLKWSREFRVGTRKFARFSLTKSNVNEYYDIRFGDIFYSDGSLSHNGYIYTNSTTGRKPIGMVVNTNESSVNDATITAIKRSQADFSGTVSDENNRGKNGSNGTGFHALVIALENATYNNSEKIVWSQVRRGNRYEPSNETLNSSEFCNTYNSLYADNAGYTKTNVVKAIYNYRYLYPAFYAAVNYNVALSPSDITSTGWFLPSAGQWLKVFDYLRGDSNPECYLVDYNDPPKTLDEWNSWIESGKAVRLDVNSGAIAPKWALVDMLDEFYMDQYLKNAGSQSSINAPGVIFRSSTECTASVSANFCVGGSTIKELTISNNKEKKSSNQEYVRAFLAF